MSIHFELVSPEQKLVSEAVKMAVIPGVEGEMGVGAGHASFVVALKPGIVKLTSLEGGEIREIYIAGGFADITGENCTVLAEDAVNVGDIDEDALSAELHNLHTDLGMAKDEAEKTRIARKIDAAKAKLSAATGKLVA